MWLCHVEIIQLYSTRVYYFRKIISFTRKKSDRELAEKEQLVQSESSVNGMMVVVGNQMWLISVTVPHKRLIHKLEQYNIKAKVLLWIECFLAEDVRG